MNKPCHECGTDIEYEDVKFCPAKSHPIRGGLVRGVQNQVWIVIFGSVALFTGVMLLNLLNPLPSVMLLGESHVFSGLTRFYSDLPVDSISIPIYSQISSYINIGRIYGIILIILGIFEIRFSMKK